MNNSRIYSALAILAVFLYVGVWQWGICRVYVAPGHMLVLSARVGRANPDPQNLRVVDDGYQGVQKVVLGEGRHFVNPFIYDRDVARCVTIGPEEIGVVKSKTGKPLSGEEFLVESVTDIYASKGIWHRVLTPGTWRLNPAAFDVEVAKVTRIPPGFCGCVTALSGAEPVEGELAEPGQRGIQRRVLQPGIYYLNPKAVKVDIVEFGFRELSLDHVTFPSRDGFPIELDITVIWGLMPESVASAMLHFGNVEQVDMKIIRPQIESICRIEGSKYGAKELIEGETREAFQRNFTQTLTNVCAEKKITVRLGLVRSIDIPMAIRQQSQQARIAMEESRTKEELQITQKDMNELAELQSDVEKGVREVAADTEKAVSEVRAEGEKKVAEIQGQRTVDVAVIEKQIAELTAARTRELGKADATVAQLTNEAEADRLKQNVDAIGGADSYAHFQFAQNLPADFKVFIRYAGPGTFWTDLPAGAKGLQDTAAMTILNKAIDKAAPAEKEAPADK